MSGTSTGSTELGSGAVRQEGPAFGKDQQLSREVAFFPVNWLSGMLGRPNETRRRATQAEVVVSNRLDQGTRQQGK